MRTGAVACAAFQTNGLTAFHSLPDSHADRIQVGVASGKSAAMLNNNAVAIIAAPACRSNSAVQSCPYRVVGFAVDIQPGVESAAAHSIVGAEFDWWRHRIEKNAALYDVIRIDHFLGVVRYYTIPFQEKDCCNGKWNKKAPKTFRNCWGLSLT